MFKRALALGLTSLFSLSLVTVASATTLHHWRFESAPGFLEDSVGTATLAGDGVQIALPIVGPGADFIPGALVNDAAAEFVGNTRLAATLLDMPTSALTVEAFFHFDSYPGSFGAHIAGAGQTAQNTSIGWALQYRVPANTLKLLLCEGASCSQIDSGFGVELGKDYFVAAALDVIDPNSSETTFYFKRG